ncbi:hypothetical protein LJ737_17410 [Hymenobacter sp. 15J16-1T3B]|uniref:hypothetical protein n=1 Tax=Hymenobacter sp. 15J16-1T3B TaxID=2886941 RepID=UPI001D108B16|nr:hypothetical protein [Hymenobacter sp. 15J16-1T3B]MCC3159025.1 hypothetical protein [Hymenobacter sp. 15J16-1T3B]
MLHSFLFAPFDDPAAEAQFDALHAVLQPLAAEQPVVLLGNLPLQDAGTLDAVLARPAGIVLLQFIGRGGALHIPALNQGAWQLAGQPLTGQAGSANPYAQFQRQRRALAAWLTAQPALGPVRTEAIAGLALFSQPVTFGSEVEPRLNAQSGTDNFQLLSSLPHLPRRMQRLHPPGAALPAAALQQWLQHLQTESEGGSGPDEAPAQPAAPDDFWTQKARQLWRWLGAEDIPPDSGYADYPADPAGASAAEKQRLEELRQQVRTELDQHTQAMTAREVEREATIRQLQQQLTQATAAPSTAELQARLAAETREKEALHEAMQLARAESAARNRELDARIAQLGTLIQQIQARPAAAPAPAGPAAGPAPGAASPPPARPAPRPVVRPRARRYSSWQLQPWRAVAVLAVLLGLVVGGWGIARLYRSHTKAAPPRREAQQPNRAEPTDESTEEAVAPTAPASPLEERLNNVVIDSTGAQSEPAATDSVLAPSKGYIDLDSTGVPTE